MNNYSRYFRRFDMFVRLLAAALFALLGVSPDVLALQPAPVSVPELVDGPTLDAQLIKLKTRADAILAEDGGVHPLLKRYLDDLQALDARECARIVKAKGDTRACWSYLARHLANLDDDGGRWQTYADRKKSLIFGFETSKGDGPQTYRVLIPKGDAPAKGFSLIVYLHGAGGPEEMRFAWSGFISANAAAVAGADGVTPIIIEPWGNKGFGADGGSDIYDAIADISKVFPVDADHIYLAGHSAGGHGVWLQAIYRPDIWAAVAPLSAPGHVGPVENLTGLPVRIWHGDADPRVNVNNSRDMAAAMEKLGMKPELVIGKGANHSIPDTEQAAIFTWLLTHTRTRPNPIIFNAIGRFNTRNGVTLHGVDGAALHVVCTIDGHTVTVTSTGVTSIDIDLTATGLGFADADPVTILWNGRQVYQAPAKKVTFTL